MRVEWQGPEPCQDLDPAPTLENPTVRPSTAQSSLWQSLPDNALDTSRTDICDSLTGVADLAVRGWTGPFGENC